MKPLLLLLISPVFLAILAPPVNAITNLKFKIIGAEADDEKVYIEQRNQQFSAVILFDLFRGFLLPPAKASKVTFNFWFDETELKPRLSRNLLQPELIWTISDCPNLKVPPPPPFFANGCNYTTTFDPPKQLPPNADPLPLYEFSFNAFNPDPFPGDGEADLVTKGSWTRNPTETLYPVSLEVIEQVPAPLPIMGLAIFASNIRRMKRLARRMKSLSHRSESD
jgi:hypothetical protein